MEKTTLFKTAGLLPVAALSHSIFQTKLGALLAVSVLAQGIWLFVLCRVSCAAAFIFSARPLFLASMERTSHGSQFPKARGKSHAGEAGKGETHNHAREAVKGQARKSDAAKGKGKGHGREAVKGEGKNLPDAKGKGKEKNFECGNSDGTGIEGARGRVRLLEDDGSEVRAPRSVKRLCLSLRLARGEDIDSEYSWGGDSSSDEGHVE